MKRKSGAFALAILIVTTLSLAACGAQPGTVVTPVAAMPVLATPLEASTQQFPDATQAQSDADLQAAATAEIERANAQATLNSANATLGAVQTQNQNNANIVAAQIAATVLIERAAARATVVSADATQSAAQTEDAIRQTQQADRATSDAGALLVQQYSNQLAAATQTAVANQIATQTQSAIATSQGYVDQARQADAERQGPLTFLLVVCLPVFLILLAGLVLWGFWRWLKIEQDNQRMLQISVPQLPPAPPPPAPKVEIIDHRPEAAALYLENEPPDHPNRHKHPDDQMQGWLDDVQDKLLNDEKKDEDDQPGA